MFWKGQLCRVIRLGKDGWCKILIRTPIPYVVFVRASELEGS